MPSTRTPPAVELAWNAGLWRGEHGYRRDVRVAPELHGTDALIAYREGWAYGARLRDADFAAQAARVRAAAAQARAAAR